MSRSGYVFDLDDEGSGALWLGAMRSAMRGKRGQAFLRELLAALDAMPMKRLVRDDLVTEDGECCALGSVALARGKDVSGVDPEDPQDVGDAFGIARAMVAELEYQNDEREYRYQGEILGPHNETPERRWERMRRWVAARIIVEPDEVLEPAEAGERKP